MTTFDPSRGRFITIEGGEGGGKSTQARALARRLTSAGIEAIATREPGGSKTAELIRDALLNGTFEGFGPRSEAILFTAARIDHLETRIIPALQAGMWVVSDRFHDSTRAYQGAAGRLDPSFIESLERVSLAGTRPDLTFILDLPARLGLSRANARRAKGIQPDRFERQTLNFHRGLRNAFLDIARQEPSRCVLIDASASAEQVGKAIWTALASRFGLVEHLSSV